MPHLPLTRLQPSIFIRAQMDSVFMLYMIERHAGKFVDAQLLNKIYQRYIKLSEEMNGHRSSTHNIYEFSTAPDAYTSRPPEFAGDHFPPQLARDARIANQSFSRFFTVL